MEIKRKFKKGDKVKVIRKYDDAEVGTTGTIAHTNPHNYKKDMISDNSEYAIKLDEDNEFGHECGNLYLGGRGYFIEGNYLEKIVKITKKKREELQKKAIAYIKKNEEHFKCFNNNLSELKKEVKLWSAEKLLDFK